MPHLYEAGLAVFASGTAEARTGGQRQLRYLTLRLVTAAAAFDENGFGASCHAPRLLRAGTSTASPARRYCMSYSVPCRSGLKTPDQNAASALSRHCFAASLTIWS